MTKRKTTIRNEYTDYSIDKEVSYMLPVYITKIHKVVNLDTGEQIGVSLTDKNVYGFLCGIGYNQGYNSIYPNIDQIAYSLGVNEKTVRRSIKTLESIKLIKVVKVTKKGRFESNHYWVYRPNMIPRVRWLDVLGGVLQGRHYNFNATQFRKTQSELKADKLLRGLLDLTGDDNSSGR